MVWGGGGGGTKGRGVAKRMLVLSIIIEYFIEYNEGEHLALLPILTAIMHSKPIKIKQYINKPKI